MPPVLKQFKGAAGSVQDAKNFWDNICCLFDDKRVGHYETANKDFPSHLKLKNRERSRQSCDIARHGHCLLEIWRTQDAGDKDAADRDLEDAAEKAKYLGDWRYKFLAALEKEHSGHAPAKDYALSTGGPVSELDRG